MEVVVINGKKRDGVGKKATNAIRNAGEVPCVLYGADGVVHFSALASEFRSLIYSPDFKLVDVVIDGKKTRCILKDKQFHPVTENILHLDFLSLHPNKTVKVVIPVRFTGNAIGVKAGGKLIQSVRKLTVKTVPEKIVSELTVDVSNLNLGQVVRVREIIVPEGLEIMNAGAIPLGIIEIPRALRSSK